MQSDSENEKLESKLNILTEENVAPELTDEEIELAHREEIEELFIHFALGFQKNPLHPEKVERYIRLIKQRHPGVRLISQEDGPAPEIVILQFGPRLSS